MAGVYGVGIDVVFVLFSEMVKPHALEIPTRIVVTSSKPHENRETIHAS